RRSADEAEALLVAARAAFYADDPTLSDRLASRSATLFRNQGREVWALRADSVSVEAAYLKEGASTELLGRAQELASDLEAAGLVYASASAAVLVGRMSIDLGHIEAARSALQRLTAVRTGPVELRIQKWLAVAMLRMADGDRQGADSAARAGLNLLDAYQSGLGATDLRAGIERLGDQMGTIGLNLAVASGRPRRVLQWMERTRGRALRYPPVVPDGDDPESDLLAELRRVTAELRKPDNVDDHQLIRRQRLLQEEIRAVNRIRTSSDTSTREMRVSDLLETLGGRTLIELGAVGDDLFAVVVRDSRFRLVELASGFDAATALSRLRFDLRRAARLNRDPGDVRAGVADFSKVVFAPLSGLSDDVVLIPPGPLMAAPWGVMPDLADATVTIAPSAETWWRSETLDGTGAGVVLASGPDLENAEAEVASLRALYRKARIFGPTDPGRTVGEAFRGTAIAHVACHASFEASNPMFSALRLGDGDFNVYDLERIGRPPDVMVLSACDSGYTDIRPGAELTGLTSALLGLGTKSVIASIGLVPDSRATANLMLEFHRGLIDGLVPSRALDAAQRQAMAEPDGYIAASSFVCVGGC
ncbi:MAG TPA: CHAT domain-containing protein, partial [Acidimicrobiia bacterium]